MYIYIYLFRLNQKEEDLRMSRVKLKRNLIPMHTYLTLLLSSSLAQWVVLKYHTWQNEQKSKTPEMMQQQIFK
jgi:hypothetical protein